MKTIFEQKLQERIDYWEQTQKKHPNADLSLANVINMLKDVKREYREESK